MDVVDLVRGWLRNRKQARQEKAACRTGSLIPTAVLLPGDDVVFSGMLCWVEGVWPGQAGTEVELITKEDFIPIRVIVDNDEIEKPRWRIEP